MAVAETGHGTALGLGEESTYGTAVARSNWLRVRSAGLARNPVPVPRGHLGTNGATSRVVRDTFVPNEDVGGPISVLAAYDDSTVLLMKHALGAVATTGSGPYTHDCTVAAPPTGLTLEQIYGDSGQADVFEGCKIDSWTFTLDRRGDGEATLDLDVIAETSAGFAGEGSPTFSSGGEVISHYDAGQLDFGSGTVQVDWQRFVVTGSRRLSRRPKQGTTQTLEPTAADFYEVTGEAVIEFGSEARTLHAAFLANTEYGTLTLTCTGTGNNQLTTELHNVEITSFSQPLQDRGVLYATIGLRAKADSSNSGCKFSFQNDNSSATAN